MLNEPKSPYGVIYGLPSAIFLFGDQLPRLEKELPNIKSVAIIGAGGQTGRFYLQELSKARTKSGNSVDLYGVCRDYQVAALQDKAQEGNLGTEIGEIMAKNPEVVIVATPNPTNNVLKELAANIHRPITIVLPQNGVDVVPVAQEIFQGKDYVNIIRASLFNTVETDDKGDLHYDQNKRRISFAHVQGDPEQIQEVDKLFKSLGFDTFVCENYVDMEWTKLTLNSIGVSSVVTGRKPRQTFRDKKIFEWELQALNERVRLMQLAGLSLVDFPWQKTAELNDSLQKYAHANPVLRWVVAEVISRKRGNRISAAWRKIEEGKDPGESLFYFRPFLELAHQFRQVPPILDQALVQIINQHIDHEINLKRMMPEQRRWLLMLFLNRISNASSPD